jgi:hypothetical protein
MTLGPVALLIVLLQHQNQGNQTQHRQLIGLGIGMIAFSAISQLSNNEASHALAVIGLFGSILMLYTWLINVHLSKPTEETWFFKQKGFMSDKFYTSLTIFKIPLYLFCLFIGTISRTVVWLESKISSLKSFLPSNLWKNIFQPMLFIGIFIALYSMANDRFASSIEALFFPLFLLIDIYEYLTLYTDVVSWVSTLCLSAVILLPFSTLGVDVTLNNSLIGSLDDPDVDLDFEEDALSKLDVDTTEKPSHLDVQLSSMTPTLIALNLLLGWFHLVDGYGLLMLDWSDAPTWSKAVHDSMNGAVLGTISGLFLLNIKSIDWSNSDNVFWGKIWAYNNALFAGMTLLKCSAYLIGFGFTEARVMVIALMMGILGSFYAALRKIVEQKSRIWFMSRIMEIQYLCFIAAVLVISVF